MAAHRLAKRGRRATSLRLSAACGRRGRRATAPGAGASSQMRVDDRAGLHLDRSASAPEDARRLESDQLRRVVLNEQHRPFAQAEDRRGIFLVEFAEALLARFALVRGAGIGIEIVAV